MTKYYINGKEISKEEAKNAELQKKSKDLNDWLGIQWITEIRK